MRLRGLKQLLRGNSRMKWRTNDFCDIIDSYEEKVKKFKLFTYQLINILLLLSNHL